MTLAPRWFIPPLALVGLGLGFFVSRSQWLIPVAFLTFIIILVATLVTDMLLVAVLTFAAVLQPPLGNVGSIPELDLVEVVAPVCLLVLALRAIARRRSAVDSASTRFADPNPARAINVAIGLYAVVIALNYVRTRFLVGPVAPGANRGFYVYFIALATYLILYSFFTSPSFDWRRFFRFLFRLSVIVSTIGVTAVLLGLPLSLGNLRYSVYDYSSGAVRVGFLETFGIIGLALVCAMKVRFRYAGGLLFSLALVVSGGRAAVVGAVIAVALYLVVNHRSWQVLAGGIIAVLVVSIAPSVGSSAQVQHLTALNQQEFSSDGRAFLYEQQLHAFASHPVIGTGAGVSAVVSGFEPKVNKFYDAQLALGGHATYTSLLKNFGLLGFLPFVVAVFMALILLAPLARSDPASAFFFIVICAEVVSMLASGNGSDAVVFVALAGGAARLASQMRATGRRAYALAHTEPRRAHSIAG